MQLHLFPPAPQPPLLFSFTLPVLPSTLPFPQAYAAQLQLLLYTEVEPPPSPYALDKAVWAVHLIEIVVFDMANRRVEVKMVDGAYMEWEMRGEEALLNRVMDGVEASNDEADREMMERERRGREEIAAAAAAAAYLPMTDPGSVSDVGHYEAKGNGGSKPMHRRSKSLFSSILSALNLNSSTEPSSAPSSSNEYRIGGRAQKDGFEPQSSATADDGERFYYPAYAISALSTSEYTYPMRAQLTRNDSLAYKVPASKVLRRRARGILVDCFRRWVIPTIRERLQWGAFPPFHDMPDLDGNSYVEGEGVKWGKISKATNAYADWACRSMISRCERALGTANVLVEGVESLAQTPSSEGGEAAEKASRRSSTSSMLASAISASSRASSSAEQVYSGQDAELDNGAPIHQNLQARTSTTALTKASKRTSASIRHVATLRNALDRFRAIHESLALDAIGLADSHTMAMRVLEARGRRKAWSSSEGGGLCRPSPLGSPPITAGPTSSSSKPRVNNLNTARAEQGYGSGNSLWELSIPLVRSTLGEISDTWEDWQMEWEMEKEFGSEVGFDDEDEEFPAIISDFDISGDSISTEYKSMAGRRSDASTSYNEDPTECGHSGFSDSSSSEDEMGGSDSDDISDRTPSPTSPSDLQACSSLDGKVGKARRGRRTGVKARMGKYEDVRNELPPDPPLMALSPPPRGKLAVSRQAPGDAGIGSSPAYNEHDKPTGRPPRPPPPSRLQVPLNDAIGSHHRREAASGPYPDFAQSRVDDSEAGVFDEWDTVDDDDGVFGCPSSSKAGATNHHHNTKPPISNIAEPCKPLKAFQIFDGLGILEQVGGVTEVTRKPLGHGYSAQNGVGIGIGYPPGLHGDLPSPPSSPTKRTITPPESPRRVSHYISRELPPPACNDTSAVVVPHAPSLVMEKETKRAGRPRPRLTLAFPDPPSYNPAELPTGWGSSLAYTHPFESKDNLIGGDSHVGGSTNQGAIAGSTGGGRTCLSNDSPALLLDTPTIEHPSTSSSYPYKWDVNVLPPGVKVLGTVGVLPAYASKSSSASSEIEMAVERSISPDALAGCVVSSSSLGGSPFNAVAKVLSKVRKVKPVLYVTPPPPPSAEDAQEVQQPIRLVKLNRSKSWKELSVAGGINFRAEIMKRRKSADSVPTVLHSEAVDTPASPRSQSQQEEEGEEEGDGTVILDDPPSLSPESAEADYSVSPMSALLRTHSELESGWATPSLVSSSSLSSATSSGFNSLNSTALDIAGDLSSSALAETGSNGHCSEAYDGIVMTPHAYHQFEPSEPTVGVVTSGGEKYAIQEGWFPKPTALEEEEEAEVVDEPLPSLDSPFPAPAPVGIVARTCTVAIAGSASVGPRKLKRAHSATRPDRAGRPPPPPPPRPVKSIKQSLSLCTFGRKFEAPVPMPVPAPANE